MGSLPAACLTANSVLRCLHLMAAGVFTYPRSFGYHACYGVVCAFLQLGCDPNYFDLMGRKGFGFLQKINSPQSRFSTLADRGDSTHCCFLFSSSSIWSFIPGFRWNKVGSRRSRLLLVPVCWLASFMLRHAWACSTVTVGTGISTGGCLRHSGAP